MSIFDTILAGTRDVLLLQYKVEQLTSRVDRLTDSLDNLRERVIRLEVIIGEAQRRATSHPPQALTGPEA